MPKGSPFFQMWGLLSPSEGAVARGWYMPIAQRLFSTQKMMGSL